MTREPLLYHAHDWVISTETYAQRPNLASFYDILATDTYDGLEFVVAVESKDYPISGVMYHPETQNRHIIASEPNNSLNGKVNS